MAGDDTDPADRPAADADVDAAGLRVALVAAVAANGVIGADGGMPWHFPADLRRFKETTTGHPVVMGRRTYESIAADLGGPLPDRTNVVLSRSAPDLPDDVVVADSVADALAAAERTAEALGVDTVYVIGGETVYEQFLAVADRLVLTEVHEAYDGDTEFPAFDADAWVETEREARDEFDFVTYDRRR
ncbi:dihydrofolate reductase [Halobaculum litoreum]|uniref:dihydrofolate reductase n=1 Tax=Halobaculum litoreum TaxID=3031998 RepID=A0ABD5XPL1_9EURY|nr:dihydrofolate reductase [Halobaculum sp. DT92]